MSMIYVKAREGRKAYYEGRVIPEDRFIPVTNTPYIRRLVDYHQDLEVETKAEPYSPPPARRERPKPQE
jgi:hypothetical protein